ncbi:hypothetical protein T484DRAFT_1893051, partial [Baffinella frigidus]
MSAAASGIIMRSQQQGRRPTHRLHRSNTPKWNEGGMDSEAMALMICFASIGTCIAFYGMWILRGSYGDPRSLLVLTFNANVANWTEAREALNTSSFAFSVNSSQPSPIPKVDTAEQKGDSRLEMAQSDVAKFTPLRFEDDHLVTAVKEPEVPARSELSRKPLPSVPAAVSMVLHAVGPTGARSEVSFGDVKLFEWSTTGANQKMCRVQVKGVWHGGSCFTLRALQGVCVRVRLDHSGADGPRWVASNKDGNARRSGCDQADEALLYVRSLQRKKRADVPDLDRIRVTVRHTEDPWLAAAALTKKTFNFGPTPRQAAMEGYIWVVVGSVLCLPCFIGYAANLCQILSAERKRKERMQSIAARRTQAARGEHEMIQKEEQGERESEEGVVARADSAST